MLIFCILTHSESASSRCLLRRVTNASGAEKPTPHNPARSSSAPFSIGSRKALTDNNNNNEHNIVKVTVTVTVTVIESLKAAEVLLEPWGSDQ